MKKSIVISLLTVIILLCTTTYSFASTGIVTTDTLRMRKDASADASIVALLSMDDKVEILGEKNGWYKVEAKADGKKVEGYVSSKYLKLQENATPVKNNTNPEQDEVKEEQNNTEENKNENIEQQKEKIMVKTLPAETKTYITPTINSIELKTLKEEKQIEIISEVNGWSYITTEDIKGWVRTENIVEKEASKTEQNSSSQKTGYISGNSVNFREEAKNSSQVISKLLKNTQVNVLNEENGWVKIEYNGKQGYVVSNYVSDKKIATTSRSTTTRTKTEKEKTTKATAKNTAKKTKTVTKTKTESVTKTVENTTTKKGNATGSEIVAYAKKFLGSKYVYGGASPSGFDCSGFTSYVYKQFGYSLARSSGGQSGNGKAIDKSELQQGDIVCFARTSGSTKIGHVGIYIGGGQFIHAANSRKGVIISNVTGAGFYYVCARRII